MRFFVIVALVLFFSCEKKSEIQNSQIIVEEIKKDSVAIQNPENLTKDQEIQKLNSALISMIKLKNYNQISEFIHPEKGVSFSMYAFTDPTTVKNFSKSEFEKYVNTNIKFTWGNHDGTGEPLVLSVKDYFEKWVYKRDFSWSKYSFNEFQGSGNSLNNLQKVYPHSDFTENYIAGSEKYGGMDWNSLRFVFEKFEGKYYLIAIINDQWTV